MSSMPQSKTKKKISNKLDIKIVKLHVTFANIKLINSCFAQKEEPRLILDECHFDVQFRKRVIKWKPIRKEN